MIVYYRDDTVRVTSAAIEVRGRTYPLGEVATVWHRPGRRRRQGWRVLLARAAYALGPVAPLVGAAGLVALAVRLDTATAHRVVLVVAAGVVALLTAPLVDLTLDVVDRTWDRGTRAHEIWARWRGREVLVLRTGDRLRFGRVYRALQRALEHSASVR
jgi:hypothetical protein